MDNDFQRAVSLRVSRRADRSHQFPQTKGGEGGFFSDGKLTPDFSLKMQWRKGFVRLLLVAGIIWMLLILVALLFHIWTCQSALAFSSAFCNKESKVFDILNNMGLVKPPHRCPIPVASDPSQVVIPKRSPERLVQSLFYVMEDDMANNGSQSRPLFGGHQTWQQRESSFKLKPSMKVHCGFMKNGGAEMDEKDIKYTSKCQFVVASAIFDGYDLPYQPSNISARSHELFCFLMVVDEASYSFIKENVTVREDDDGGNWVGIWRLILLKQPPYDEPRRNGKVPKILIHRLFSNARYSIWIDGKMELIVDPLLILERALEDGTDGIQDTLLSSWLR